MKRAEIGHYRSVATAQAIEMLLSRMSERERSELGAVLSEQHKTLQEYVGSLLTAHERWDLVEWTRVPDSDPQETPAGATVHRLPQPGRTGTC